MYITLAVLLIPPAVALVMMALATLGYRQRAVQTGDAVLDTYLQALVDSGVLMNPDTMTGLNKQSSPPEAQWLRWEQAYGKDPRFWMLCYHMRPGGENYLSPVAGVKLPGAARFLEQARKRGAADWVVLLRLAEVYDSAWRQEAIDALGLTYPGRSATQQDRQEYYAKLSAEAERLHGQAWRPLLAELREAGAGQAIVHYELAIIASRRNDLPGALKEVEAGNAAPRNDSGLGLPYDKLLQTAARGELLAGDIALSGQLSTALIHVYPFNSLQYKNLVRALTAWAQQRNDLSALQTLHISNCRIGTAREAWKLQVLTALVSEEIVLDAAAQAAPPISARRQQELSKARILRGQLSSSLRNLLSSSQPIPAMPSGLTTIQDNFPATYAGGSFYMLELLDGFAQDLITEQSALAGPIRKQVEDLAKLDLR